RFAALGERWVSLRRQQELEAQLRSTQEWAERAQAEVNRLFPLHRSTQDRHRLAVSALSQARFDIVQLERRAQAAEDAIRAEAIEHAT
ncbi:hypothetical protein, partial [Enterococcus faecium]|uniref:hypothetical protein n=1 Tax=Enterococcus faecium TaxID=1352 RepID=UPI003F430360